MTTTIERQDGRPDRDRPDPATQARLVAILTEVDQLIVGGNGEEIRRAALMIYFDRYGGPELVRRAARG